MDGIALVHGHTGALQLGNSQLQLGNSVVNIVPAVETVAGAYAVVSVGILFVNGNLNAVSVQLLLDDGAVIGAGGEGHVLTVDGNGGVLAQVHESGGGVGVAQGVGLMVLA